MRPFFVYMLLCGDGSYYVGHTDDLERRVQQHLAAEDPDSYTAKRHPLELVFSQEFPTRDEAIQREVQIKGWSRAKKEALTRSDWAEVQRLSRKHRA